MKYIHVLLVFILIQSSFTIASPIVRDQNTVDVVATVPFLADFAENLLSDQGSYHSIIKPSQDPHFVEPSAEDLTKLEEADVILAIGHEALDEWILDFITDNGNLADKVIFPIDLEETLIEDPIIDALNPHFWLSPVNAKTMTSNIADGLIAMGLAVSTVQTNLPIYLSDLDDLLLSLSAMKSEYQGTKIVEDHPAFLYLSNLLGLERVGVLEEHEGVDPSPLHLQELSDKMKEEDVKLILASKIQASSDVQELARMSGAKIAYLHTLPGSSDVESYIDMIEYNMNAIKNPEEPSEEDSLPNPFLPVILGIIVITIFQRRRVNRITTP